LLFTPNSNNYGDLLPKTSSLIALTRTLMEGR
jgi:hypothetical protein